MTSWLSQYFKHHEYHFLNFFEDLGISSWILITVHWTWYSTSIFTTTSNGPIVCLIVLPVLSILPFFNSGHRPVSLPQTHHMLSFILPSKPTSSTWGPSHLRSDLDGLWQLFSLYLTTYFGCLHGLQMHKPAVKVPLYSNSCDNISNSISNTVHTNLIWMASHPRKGSLYLRRVNFWEFSSHTNCVKSHTILLL